MGRFVDLTGQRFGRLTVIRPLGYSKITTKNTDRKKGVVNTSSMWECQCDCGNVVNLPAIAFSKKKDGTVKTRSCGCLGLETKRKNGNRSVETGQTQQAYENAGFYKNTCVSMIASKKLSKRNTSGVKGVGWSKKERKWRARIYLQGKEYLLGYFDDLEEAKKARQKAEEELFQPIIEEYKSQQEELQ